MENGRAQAPCRSGCRKSPSDFFDSLHNASLFCPRNGPKSCRCAAQTPAGAGFLQAFDPIRRGSRPLVLPLQKELLYCKQEIFDTLNGRAQAPCRFMPDMRNTGYAKGGRSLPLLFGVINQNLLGLSGNGSLLNRLLQLFQGISSESFRTCSLFFKGDKRCAKMYNLVQTSGFLNT